MLPGLLENGRGLKECGGALYLKVWGRARDHMVECILGNLIGIGWE